MPRGARPKEYPAAMVARVSALYADGRTQSEIASELGTTQKVIFNLMRRHGLASRVAAKRDQSGPRNNMWKGDAAGYQALHLRIERRRGRPSACETCGTTDPAKTYDWANLSGRYEDVDDYARMCRSCHWRYDGTVKNLQGAQTGGDTHA
jgi:hypothetical protein